MTLNWRFLSKNENTTDTIWELCTTPLPTVILCGSEQLKQSVTESLYQSRPHAPSYPSCLTLKELLTLHQSAPDPDLETVSIAYLFNLIKSKWEISAAAAQDYARELYRLSIESSEYKWKIPGHHDASRMVYEYQEWRKAAGYRDWMDIYSDPLPIATKHYLSKAQVIFNGWYHVPPYLNTLMEKIASSTPSHTVLGLECARHLVDENTVDAAPMVYNPSTPATFWTATDATEESVFVLNHILEKLGVGYSEKDILVVLPNMGAYKRDWDRVLSWYPISARESVGLSLRQTTLGQIFKQLIDLLRPTPSAEQFQSMVRVLSQAKFKSKAAAIWPQLIESVAATVPQKHGSYAEQWAHISEHFLNRPLSSKFSDAVSSLRPVLKEQAPDILAALKQWDHLCAQRDAQALAEGLSTWLSTVFPAEANVPSEIAAADTIQELLKQLPAWHAKISASQEISLHTLLHTGVQTRSLPVPASTGITVTSRKEAYGASFPLIFVLGLSATQWPDSSHANPFMPASQREKAGMSESEFLYKESEFLLWSLRQHSQELVLSYASNAGDSFALASPYLDDIPLAATEPIRHSAWNPRDRSQVLADALSQDASGIDKTVKDRASIFNRISQTQPGQLDPQAVSEQMQSITSQPLSPSRLTQYQRCPQQYLFEKLLGLPQLSVLDGIAASDWGLFIHQLLETVLSQDIPEPTDALLKSMLQSEAAKMLSEQGRHFDWLVKSDLLFGSPQRAGLLDALASCIAELLHDYELLALEHPINTSIDAAEGCMRLHGRIDLILKEKEGRGLIIIDYKTGSTIPKSIEVETVDNLQLPIYMLSMDSPSTPVAALMVCQIHHAHPVHTQLVACNSEYSAKDFNKKGRPFRWEAIEYSAEIRDQLLRLYRGIQAAEFQVENPSRHPRRLKAQSQTCKFCDFKSICQYPGRYD